MAKLHVQADRPDEVSRAGKEGAAVLARGGVVGLPTETVYGLAALAASEPGRAALAARSTRPAKAASTWHAPSVDAVLELTGLGEPLHKRIVQRLLPGPVLIEVELGVLGAGRWPISGLPAGAADSEGRLRIRVPSHPVARAVLAAVGVPVLVDRSPAAAGDGHEPPVYGPGSQPDLEIESGPTMHRASSTVVRLWGRGAAAQYAVVSEGAVTARVVHKRVIRRVLFVCTGNTCRSPMAEAIARARIGEMAPAGTGEGSLMLGGVPTEIASAGVAAEEDSPASPQTVDALRAVGVTPVAHRAKQLTPGDARDADVIYTMSASHARAVAAIGPEVAAKVRLIDPAGRDVPDPVGGPVALYISTAQRLDEMIRRRLGELASGGNA